MNTYIYTSRSGRRTKRQIDRSKHGQFYKELRVNLVRLSDEDITTMKLGKKQEVEHTTIDTSTSSSNVQPRALTPVGTFRPLSPVPSTATSDIQPTKTTPNKIVRRVKQQIFKELRVNLIRWSDEDIAQMKLGKRPQIENTTRDTSTSSSNVQPRASTPVGTFRPSSPIASTSTSEVRPTKLTTPDKIVRGKRPKIEHTTRYTRTSSRNVQPTAITPVRTLRPLSPVPSTSASVFRTIEPTTPSTPDTIVGPLSPIASTSTSEVRPTKLTTSDKIVRPLSPVPSTSASVFQTIEPTTPSTPDTIVGGKRPEIEHTTRYTRTSSRNVQPTAITPVRTFRSFSPVVSTSASVFRTIEPTTLDSIVGPITPVPSTSASEFRTIEPTTPDTIVRSSSPVASTSTVQSLPSSNTPYKIFRVLSPVAIKSRKVRCKNSLWPAKSFRGECPEENQDTTEITKKNVGTKKIDSSNIPCTSTPKKSRSVNKSLASCSMVSKRGSTLIVKTPNRDYGPLAMTDTKFKKKASTSNGHSTASHQLNNLHEDLSFFVPNVRNGSFKPFTSTKCGNSKTKVVTFKSPHKNVENVNIGGNQYSLIRHSRNHVRAVTRQNSTKSITPIKHTNCLQTSHGNDCSNNASITCKSCSTITYCYHDCKAMEWHQTRICDKKSDSEEEE